MGPRVNPGAERIAEVLTRSGSAATHALTEHQATRVVRLAFKTTGSVAFTWLQELSAMIEPQVLLVSSSSHNSLDAAWRRDGWTPLERLGFMEPNPSPHDFVMLRPNGSQTLDEIPENRGVTHWVVLADTLRDMAERTRHYRAMQRKEQQEKAAANLAKFTQAHPRAVKVMRELLDSAGARNAMTEIRATHTGHDGRTVDGVALGGPNYLALTLYDEDIDAVTALLAELMEPRS